MSGTETLLQLQLVRNSNLIHQLKIMFASLQRPSIRFAHKGQVSGRGAANAPDLRVASPLAGIVLEYHANPQHNFARIISLST